MQKEESTLVLFLLNMEGRCRLVTSIRSVRRRPTTLRVPLRGSPTPVST